jgi:hypothetical protein
MHLLILLAFLVMGNPLMASRITYAEEWYKLYHMHLHRYPADELDNLIYLERALDAHFSNALYALAPIQNEKEWEYYQLLFKLHVNLQIVRTYMAIAMKYDREKVYFYNAPWRDANLRSLLIAEEYYQRALFFWQATKPWIEQLNTPAFRWMHIPALNNWQQELTKINNGDLDFEKIINRHLNTLQEHRSFFESLEITPS